MRPRCRSSNQQPRSGEGSQPTGGAKRNPGSFVSEVLHGELLGLEAIDDGVYRVWFCSLQLGTFDERRGGLAPLPRCSGQRRLRAGFPASPERLATTERLAIKQRL